jgi:3-isopropylmalate dehydrogenase
MKKSVVFLAGDGVGPEVTEQAKRVLLAAASKQGIVIECHDALMGGAAIDAVGSPLPEDTLSQCRKADAVFLGAVGGPKWANVPVAVRPEQGLLALRKALGLFANLRPVKTLPALADASPIKSERLANVDIMVVRELTGGIYFGKRQRTATAAFDTCEYSVEEIERVCRMAAELARQRRGKITSVDKANVLDTSRLWRDVATRVFAEEFPELQVEHLLVDAAAMHLLSRPADFDVMVTENMFGDILTDEASMLAGSLGLLPSASIGASGPGLYEPIHGSAPDIAGRGIANPCGAILSAAMLLRHAFGNDAAAASIEQAVAHTLEAGIRTADVALPGKAPVGTAAFGAAVIAQLP